MKTVNDTIAESMDCTDISLLPYLPYILQDFYKIGSSPELMLNIVKNNFTDHTNINVLDLGCGKGAVSIEIAKKLKCKCLGIDAIDEFIKFANFLAKEHNINNRCKFINADIRKEIDNVHFYDVIILGSIGPVFGDYFETMKILKKHLTPTGIIILDDGYIEDENRFEHNIAIKRSTLFQQINKANMKIKKEYINFDNDKSNEYGIEFNNIVKRCSELGKKYPEKKKTFDNYVSKQKEEYFNLENQITCSAMVICNK